MSIVRNGMLWATNNPKNVVVHTSERYLTKDTARMISRKVLLKQVAEKCEYYIKNDCRACDTEKEIDCIGAWKLTTGKGKKIY